MRLSAALVLVLVLAGCDAFGPSRVEHGVVTSVTIERLDLDRRWDGDLFSRNPPDVYVDIKVDDPNGFLSYVDEVYRSSVAENLEADRLPLTVRPRADDDARIALRDTVWVNVVDRDGTLDDLMLTSGRFSLGDSYDGEPAGETETLRFENEDGAFRVTVRWE